MYVFFFKTAAFHSSCSHRGMYWLSHTFSCRHLKGRDFLDMHIHYCSQFMLLSKDVGCVKMHCSLFAKACCYLSLQTETIPRLPRPPHNNLNLLSSVNQGWLNATSQVHLCPGLPPLLVAKAQHRSLLARSSLFVASVEQESRSRPQC